jgi:hydrogenase maturation protein HypF
VAALERRLLRVTGTVQGVGFRPFVYRIARRDGLLGWVRNDVHGVTVEAIGATEVLERFAHALAAEAPPAARVEGVVELECGPALGPLPAAFVIVASEDADDVTTAISADLPVCDDCLAEMRDPSDRRHRYPFVNCTNCGPRYSIVEALPYDRPLTTMKGFAMCPACEAEYHDPLDRRFHAQPTACPTCGPQLVFLDGAAATAARAAIAAETDAAPGAAAEDEDPFAWRRRAPDAPRGDAALAATVAALRAGQIVAVKGLGGYHLACDARGAAAVAALRARKFRKEKAFAVMARDLDAIDGYALVDATAAALLASTARPIVLLPKGPVALPDALAPENAAIGVMLPYTPVHHLLFDGGAPDLLVMTSANRSAEPIAYRDAEALASLAGLADVFLVGERPIARRVDDGVAQVVAGEAAVVRRARGLAPAPVVRDGRFDVPVLALGPELKSSVTLAVSGAAYVSQHLGDLSDLASYEAFRETVADLCAMYRVDPHAVLVAVDRHPAYPSSRFAAELGAPTVAIGHHEAHVASVLVERGAWSTAALGFAFDGAGLGDDGTVWGGEVFHGTLEGGFRRVAHVRPARLPGGDAAARTPVQAAAGWLDALGDGAFERVLRPPFGFPAERLAVARKLLAADLRSPVTTSVGRLFDTVAALTGFGRTMSFEGQAAIGLETLAWRVAEAEPYPWPFARRAGDALPTWDHAPLLAAVLEDVEAGVAGSVVARRFHEALAAGVVDAALALRPTHPFEVLALSGGVFQNRLLVERVVVRAAAHDLSVWRNRAVPANDGGVSLGQAALAAARR